MKRASLLLVSIFAGVLWTAQALASPPGFGPRGGGPGPDPAGFLAHHAERLGLDESTTRSIEALVDASRERADALREQLRAAHDELHTLLSVDAPDESAVMAQAEVIGGLETELHKERLRALLKIHALLTPEQRAELQRIREEGPFARFRAARDACADDAARLCPDAPREGPHALFCLKGRRSEVSASCGEALDGLPQRVRHGPRREERESR